MDKIRIENLLHYGDFQALKKVNLNIKERNYSLHRAVRLRKIHPSEEFEPNE